MQYLLITFFGFSFHHTFSLYFVNLEFSSPQFRPTLKDCSFPTNCIVKKLFFTLFKQNITFYFKCYLHHNCSMSLNGNNTQYYSSAKPLHVTSSIFLFVNFCFLPFLRRTRVQKWKKNWFCYLHK